MYLGSIGGQHSTMVSILASGSSCPGFEFQHSQKKSEEKLLTLVRLIDGAGERKVDTCLKLLIKPILVQQKMTYCSVPFWTLCEWSSKCELFYWCYRDILSKLNWSKTSDIRHCNRRLYHKNEIFQCWYWESVERSKLKHCTHIIRSVEFVSTNLRLYSFEENFGNGKLNVFLYFYNSCKIETLCYHLCHVEDMTQRTKMYKSPLLMFSVFNAAIINDTRYLLEADQAI